MTTNALNILPVKTASCSVMGDYAIAKKRTVAKSKAKRGDLVLYDFNHNRTSDHTGIIYKVSGNTLYVVEGNTSKTSNDNGGCVMKRSRINNRDVNYIVRPRYNAKVTADMVVRTALAEVGTKEKPRNSNTVKYNTWYYGRKVKGSKYPWCMVFVMWCFAHVIEPPKPKPIIEPASEPKTYRGTFPTLPPKTAKLAVECAYAYGTKLSKYKYKGGKAKEAYKKRLNQAYPNRKGWKYAKSRAGASCDVFAGTVLKCAGYKSAPHAMSKMVSWCRKHLKAAKSMQNGDVLTRTNHVMIVVDLKGKKRVANAHFQDHGGTYGIIQAVGKYTHIWRPSGVSYFSKGDTFTDVKKLQKFLNWYGGYGLKEDYIFGTKTEDAVKDFESKEGLKQDGVFGKICLDKARTVKR